jgi:hypothetical protein
VFLLEDVGVIPIATDWSVFLTRSDLLQGIKLDALGFVLLNDATVSELTVRRGWWPQGRHPRPSNREALHITTYLDPTSARHRSRAARHHGAWSSPCRCCCPVTRST